MNTPFHARVSESRVMSKRRKKQFIANKPVSITRRDNGSQNRALLERTLIKHCAKFAKYLKLVCSF